jgi:hypothetical protein
MTEIIGYCPCNTNTAIAGWNHGLTDWLFIVPTVNGRLDECRGPQTTPKDTRSRRQHQR